MWCYWLDTRTLDIDNCIHYMYMNMNTIFLIPSFYAHAINGLFLLVSFFILYKNYSKIIKFEPYNLIVITLLFSICLGVHGISHAFLEKIYGYNPVTLLVK